MAQDVYLWAKTQAEYLKMGNWAELDIENIAEEIAALARYEEKELGQIVQAILVCLLKTHYQPERRQQPRVVDSIEDQRDRLRDCLEDSPSLVAIMEKPQWVEKYYQRACVTAARELEKSLKSFPLQCPYRLEQICTPEFDLDPNGDFYQR